MREVDVVSKFLKKTIDVPSEGDGSTFSLSLRVSSFVNESSIQDVTKQINLINATLLWLVFCWILKK